MTASEAFDAIAARKISLVFSFDAFWHASVDVKGETLTTKKRNVRSISVIALTPIGAVEALLGKLDAEPTDQELFDEARIEDRGR
jgi:hypothetical protein